MPRLKRRVAFLLAFGLTGLYLFACLSVPNSSSNATQQTYSLAQATLDQGRSDLNELSHKATAVGQEMLQAAAAQEDILEQTRSASTAESIALAQAATELNESAAATLFADNMGVTQTAQAQAILNSQARQTAELNATQTAFSLTATPWAALQADITRERIKAAQMARFQAYVVNPVKAGLWLVAGLVLLVVAMWILRLLINYLDPVSWPITMRTLRPLNKPLLSPDETSPVDVVGPADPSIINWISEAEKQLRIHS